MCIGVILCNLTDSLVYGANFSTSEIPIELINYREYRYTPTIKPKGSPLGGYNDVFYRVTAYYNDPNYFKKFGNIHTGVDLIPNKYYFAKSGAYKLSNEIIIISTLSGKACSFGNKIDGYTVTIVRDIYKAKYHHQSINFIPIGKCIQIENGTPIGIMGDTGNATGIHLHYSLYKLNNKNVWKDYNPLNTLSF